VITPIITTRTRILDIITTGRIIPSLKMLRTKKRSNRIGISTSICGSSSNDESNNENETMDNDDENDNDLDIQNYDYDLAVVGGGPAGAHAAILAARSSYLPPSSSSSLSSRRRSPRVVLIDSPKASGALRDSPSASVVTTKSNINSNDISENPIIITDDPADLSLGGPTGLFSKALRDASKRVNVESLRSMGLSDDGLWGEVLNSIRTVARYSSNDVREQLKDEGVDTIVGLARFPGRYDMDDENNISLKGRTDVLIVGKDRALGHNDNDIDNDNNNANVGNQKKKKETRIRVKNVILATGSKPFRPPNVPFDIHPNRIFDSDTINSLSYLPKSVAITGSGVVAIEFAKIFRNLGGAEVTLIVRDPVPRRALEKSGLDRDISAVMVADLVKCGIKIERGCEATAFQVPERSMKGRPEIRVTLEPKKQKFSESEAAATTTTNATRKQKKSEVKCDVYLAAVGRIPNTSRLNLKDAGIACDEYGALLVNDRLCCIRRQTDDDKEDKTKALVGNVYGAGDILGRPFLASVGVAQATAVVRSLYGSQNDAFDSTNACDPRNMALNPYTFPSGIWSTPEVSYYGLTAKAAIESGQYKKVGEGVALYSECLRGLGFAPLGLLKLVFDQTDTNDNCGDGTNEGGETIRRENTIIGVHIIGDDACELIHHGMELVKGGRTLEDAANGLYGAVTYHEMYRIAAERGLDSIRGPGGSWRKSAGKATSRGRRRRRRDGGGR